MKGSSHHGSAKIADGRVERVEARDLTSKFARHRKANGKDEHDGGDGIRGGGSISYSFRQ